MLACVEAADRQVVVEAERFEGQRLGVGDGELARVLGRSGSSGNVEVLSYGSLTLTIDAQISDDQRLVAATTNDGGWYEFAAAPT